MSGSKIKMPSKKTMRVMDKKLKKGQASFLLPPDADAVARTKYELCRQIVIFMRAKDLSQRDLAKKIGVPETRVSEIVHYRIEKFTVDRLLSHLEKLNPKVVLRVA